MKIKGHQFEVAYIGDPCPDVLKLIVPQKQIASLISQLANGIQPHGEGEIQLNIDGQLGLNVENDGGEANLAVKTHNFYPDVVREPDNQCPDELSVQMSIDRAKDYVVKLNSYIKMAEKSIADVGMVDFQYYLTIEGELDCNVRYK